MARVSSVRDKPDRQSLSSDDRGERHFWGWLSFSFVLHMALIATLFLIPNVGQRRSPSFPVYTVELVGGERVGGATRVLETPVRPAAPKPETKTKSEPPPRVAVAEKKEKKALEPVPVATKDVMKEVEKSPEIPEPAKGVSDELREKLIQAALEGVKRRVSQASQKSAQAESSPADKTTSKEGTEQVLSGPGEGAGAAAPGAGGTGGGIVKDVEFIVYRNRMLQQIKDRWTWIGKRSDLEVTVRFGIQDHGEISGLKITHSSGDSSFDNSVLRAVRNASPLGAPPEKYRVDFRDVELTFRPRDLRS